MSDASIAVVSHSPPQPFAHLHCHTHYSLLDGANRIDQVVKKVKGEGMNALAITDHGNLYGALEFYNECRGASINPILGLEAYIAPGSRFDKSGASRVKEACYHLTLLAMNAVGFQNLVKLSSAAFLEGFYHRPRIDKEILEQHNEGLILLSGCAAGELSQLLLGGRDEEAERLVAWYSKVFGDRLYMEIQNAGFSIQKQCMDMTVDLANRMGLPLVATNDAHYLNQSDAAMHDVLLCVNTKVERSDINRMKMDTDQLFVRTPDEMYAAFPGFEAAVARSQEIANRVDIQLDLKSRHYPVFQPPEGKKDIDYLRELCYEGMIFRYGADGITAAHRERMDFELSVIEKMGYASYFLIVWDFVRFAVEQGIPCSARGSACGAIVAYVLRLSHVCPLEYDLLFERFLDPSRTEPPDIDIDFCRDRRQAVIDYTKQKYGERNVAQIGTYGTLKAKNAIRDVGLRMQRGGVGYYPTAYTPFVHLDAGSVRHWPRMSHDQLARIFPSGKTVHIPSNGRPLERYAEAEAEIIANGGSVMMAGLGDSEADTSDRPKTKSLWATLFGGGNDDEDADIVTQPEAAPQIAKAPAKAVETAQAEPEDAAPAKPVVVAALSPAAQSAQPAIAAKASTQPIVAQPIPLPLGRNQKGGIGEAIMVGPAQPQFVWQKGAEPVVTASLRKVTYSLVAMRLPPMREKGTASVPAVLAAANVPLPPVRQRENVKVAEAVQTDPVTVGSIAPKSVKAIKAAVVAPAAKAKNIKTANVKAAIKSSGSSGFTASPDTILKPGVFSGGFTGAQQTVSAGFQAN